MSTRCDEIEVPREFLPEFVMAATLNVMGGAATLGGGYSGDGLSLDFSDENRRQDDEKIARMLETVAARAAILRALDEGVRVPVVVLRGFVDEAIATLRDNVQHLAGGTAVAVDVEHLATQSRLLRDLSAWCAENGLVNEAVAA